MSPEIWEIEPPLSEAVAQQGVADAAGGVMYSGIADSEEGDAGTGGAESDFIAMGVRNGAFEQGPNDSTQNIELVNNPLPYWDGPTQVSGGAITCSWVDDSSGTAKNLRFTMAPGAASDEAYVEQIVRIPHSKAFTIAPTFIAYCSTAMMGTAANAVVRIAAQFLQADGITTTGAAYGPLGFTFTSVNAQTGNLRTVTAYPNTTGVVPLDAAFVRIRLHVHRNTAATTDAGSIDITDVRLQRGDIQVLLTDDSDPATYGYGSVFQTNGVLYVYPDSLGADRPFLALDADSSRIILNSTGGVNFPEVAAPATPSSGLYKIYAKTDGILYGKNDAGTEHNLTTATSVILAGIIQPSISANQNNYAPTGATTASIWSIDCNNAARTITGISATGMTEGQTIWISGYNQSGNTLTLAHASASSSSGNRFSCPSAADYVIQRLGGVMIIYQPSVSSANPWNVLGKA